MPAVEFQALLEDIDKQLDLQLEFPKIPGFRIRFSDKGSPRARYLGQLTPKIDLTLMERMIPGPQFKEKGENEVLDDRSFAAFKKKIEAAIEAGKNKSKAAKEKKRNERVVQKKGWCAQLKRAQRYLGVRPRRTATENDDPLQHLDPPWEELEKARRAYQLAAGINLPEMDVAKPIPCPFDLDVVFVCVDVEAYEREHKAITEIGISSLDTRDLIGVSPGEGGTAWFNKIRSRHFRIREYSHLRNTEFVAGCADRFEKAFGTSEWVFKEEAPKVVASCFRPPFATRPLDITTSIQYPSIEQSQTGPFQSNGSASNVQHDDNNQPKRNLILVGHDIKTDIDYLRELGYNVRNLSNLLEAIDTVDLYRALKQEQNPRNLGQVLLDLGLTGWNLHNAVSKHSFTSVQVHSRGQSANQAFPQGNDAAYTLQSMIGITFASLATNNSHQATAPANRAARLETVAKEAQDRVKEDSEEWELATGEGGDGGQAVRLPRPDPDWEALGPIPAKSKKAVAKEKAVREKKRVEQGAASRVAASVGSGSAGSHGSNGKGQNGKSISKPNGNKTKKFPTNKATPEHTNGQHQTHNQPANLGNTNPIPQTQNQNQPVKTQDLPTHFAERMAFLDMDDDDDEGGVTLVYK